LAGKSRTHRGGDEEEGTGEPADLLVQGHGNRKKQGCREGTEQEEIRQRYSGGSGKFQVSHPRDGTKEKKKTASQGDASGKKEKKKDNNPKKKRLGVSGTLDCRFIKEEVLMTEMWKLGTSGKSQSADTP